MSSVQKATLEMRVVNVNGARRIVRVLGDRLVKNRDREWLLALDFLRPCEANPDKLHSSKSEFGFRFMDFQILRISVLVSPDQRFGFSHRSRRLVARAPLVFGDIRPRVLPVESLDLSEGTWNDYLIHMTTGP